VSIRGSKIKELSQNIKNTSNTLSSLFDPIRGYFCEKNSEFFYRHFYGKSLENRAKTAKKTPQKWSKNTLFFDVFLSGSIIK